MPYKLISEGKIQQQPEMKEPEPLSYRSRHTMSDLDWSLYAENVRLPYENHIASLETYDVINPPEEWKGREDLEEGKDFKVKVQVQINGCWLNTDFWTSEYQGLEKRTVAIPTAEQKEADPRGEIENNKWKGYYSCLNEKKSSPITAEQKEEVPNIECENCEGKGWHEEDNEVVLCVCCRGRGTVHAYVTTDKT